MNFSFADEYKKWSNEQLFELLKNEQLYQPAAVAAAQFEFTSRKLTESELEFGLSLVEIVRRHRIQWCYL
jgi:hypothetical protein